MSSPIKFVPLTISSSPDDLVKPMAIAFFKGLIVSVILSSIVYGFVVLLCFNSLSLLMKTTDTGSQRRRFMLLAYIITMFLLSTGTLIQEILLVMKGLQPFGEQRWWSVLTSPNNPDTTPFIILGADGLLVWRCLVLYKDIHKAFKILLCVIIASLASADLVGSVGLLSPLQTSFVSTLLIAVSTLTCNAIFSTMIICRILQHNRKIRRLGHGFNHSHYSGIISMFIESAILMVAVSLLYIISYATNFPVVLDSLSVYLLPQISIISTLLIIFRVAQGRAFMYGQSAEEVRSGIQFQNSHQSAVSTV